jgi:hypothetical protein
MRNEPFHAFLQCSVWIDEQNYSAKNVITNLSCLHKGRNDTESGNDSDAEGVIIVIINRPQDDAGNLKDVKRVDNLRRYLINLVHDFL